MKKYGFLTILIIAIGTIFYTHSLIQDKNLNDIKTHKINTTKKQNVNVLALGDSLTQGIGDENSDGYVSLISQKIRNNDDVKVKTYNYGISGETSIQIDKRVNTNKELQTNINKADVITLTVGGNDLMHILMKKGLKLSKTDIVEGTDKFENNLSVLIKDIRNYNNNAPIYILGIYNPFSIYLKQIKYMDIAVKAWNEKSKKTTFENYKTYFVNIDKIMSSPKVKKTKKGDIENPLLYKKDHFHPNEKGYRLISKELYKKMKSNNDEWLYVR